jgi:hypothetical protein
MAGLIHCLASFKLLYPVFLKTKVAKKTHDNQKTNRFQCFYYICPEKDVEKWSLFLLSLDIQALKGT